MSVHTRSKRANFLEFSFRSGGILHASCFIHQPSFPRPQCLLTACNDTLFLSNADISMKY